MASSPAFPVDAVFTWVDGADPVWLEQKQALRRKLYGDALLDRDADDPARFRNNDELRYALRSLARCAPWIRKVHVVTADQKPSWLNLSAVNLVSHRDIFPPQIPLPVFTGQAIEYCLHRIPGLAEQFLYFNDDFMLGRELRPGDFFLADGRPRVWVDKKSSRTTRRLYGDGDTTAVHATVARKMAARHLVLERYGIRFPYGIRHFPKPMARASVQGLWDTFPAVVEKTLRAPFRSPENITINMLYPLYLLATGQGEARIINGWRQIRDCLFGGLAHMGASVGDKNMRQKMRYIRWLRPRTFCLNDSPRATEQDCVAMRDFLHGLYPEPCRFERQAAAQTAQ